ncbi:hypothetical protein bcgnr5368_56540 [Bacillus cereus]
MEIFGADRRRKYYPNLAWSIALMFIEKRKKNRLIDFKLI